MAVERFPVFIENQPQASLPLLATDAIPIVRDGVTYFTPPTTFESGDYPMTYIKFEPVEAGSYEATEGLGAVRLVPDSPLNVYGVTLPPNPVDKQIFELSTADSIGELTVLGAGSDTLDPPDGPYRLQAGEGLSWQWTTPTIGNAAWMLRYNESNVAHLDLAQQFLAAQYMAASLVAPATLTFTPDLELGNIFVLVLVDSNSNVIANPENLAGAVGLIGKLVIQQSSAGNDLVSSWGAAYKFTAATPPTLSTGASAIDVFDITVLSATYIAVGPSVLNLPAS